MNAALHIQLSLPDLVCLSIANCLLPPPWTGLWVGRSEAGPAAPSLDSALGGEERGRAAAPLPGQGSGPGGERSGLLPKLWFTACVTSPKELCGNSFEVQSEIPRAPYYCVLNTPIKSRGGGVYLDLFPGGRTALRVHVNSTEITPEFTAPPRSEFTASPGRLSLAGLEQ